MDDARWSVLALTTGSTLLTSVLAASAWWTVSELAPKGTYVSPWWLAVPLTMFAVSAPLFSSALFGWPWKPLAQQRKPPRWRSIGEWDRGEP